jgi:chemotaxis protein CheC
VPEVVLEPSEQAALQRAIAACVEHASDGLAEMTGRDLRLRTRRVSLVPLQGLDGELPDVSAPTVAVYLWLATTLPAHMVLLLPPERAREVVDMLLGEPLGTTRELDDLGRSALGEVGNLMGAYFANTLSDMTGQITTLTTPTVLEDIMGAILDSIFVDLGVEHDVVLLVETSIVQDAHDVNGVFLVLPDPSGLHAFLDSLAARP